MAFKEKVITFTQEFVKRILKLESETKDIYTKLNEKDPNELTILEFKSNGNSWYRLWSNGWLEQGNITTNRTSTGGFWEVFPIPFNMIPTLTTGSYGGYMGDGSGTQVWCTTLESTKAYFRSTTGQNTQVPYYAVSYTDYRPK